MMALAIHNNSVNYNYKGTIVAGDASGTNCALTVKNYAPTLIEANKGEKLFYEDFKGQTNSSSFPVSLWEINDGVNPPYTVTPWDPILSYEMPVLTKWAYSNFQLVNPSTNVVVYTDTIQRPGYLCASNHDQIITSGLPTDVYMEWVYIDDVETGRTLTAIIINDL